MNKYETVFLISTKIAKEQREIAVSKIQKLIAKKAKITKTEDLGEKKLAYKIKEEEKAFYYVINFESDSSFIKELEHTYRITEEILKFIIVRND